jgi:hypothetical protein
MRRQEPSSQSSSRESALNCRTMYTPLLSVDEVMLATWWKIEDDTVPRVNETVLPVSGVQVIVNDCPIPF